MVKKEMKFVGFSIDEKTKTAVEKIAADEMRSVSKTLWILIIEAIDARLKNEKNNI